MQAPHRAAVPIKGQVLLGYFGIEAVRREFVPALGARQETAFVFSRVDVDQPCAVKSRRGEDHSESPARAYCSSECQQPTRNQAKEMRAGGGDDAVA